MKKELGEKLQEHKQALIDAALEHGRVKEVNDQLQLLLTELGRKNIKINTEVRLGEEAISITIILIYRILYPGEEVSQPKLAREMRLDEEQLADALSNKGFTILRGSAVVNAESHLCVFRGLIDFQGNLVEQER